MAILYQWVSKVHIYIWSVRVRARLCVCVCVCRNCLRMATKQGDGVEKRKHLTTASAQRKEKSQKTSKTHSKVNDVITNTTTTEKKNTVFCSLSIVCLGRAQFNMSNIRSEMYRRCRTRDLSYGSLYTWGLFYENFKSGSSVWCLLLVFVYFWKTTSPQYY